MEPIKFASLCSDRVAMDVLRKQTFRCSVVKSQEHQQGDAFQLVAKCAAWPTVLTKYMRQPKVKGSVLSNTTGNGRRAAHTVLEGNGKRGCRNRGLPLAFPLFQFPVHGAGV